MSVRASQDRISADVDAVSRDQWAKDLRHWLANSCVVDFHDSVPSASHTDVGVIWHKLSAEHSVLVPIQSNSIALHLRDQLPGHLVVEVDFEISASRDELEPIAREVAGEERVIFLLDRVLKLARARIPMIDNAVASHTQ